MKSEAATNKANIDQCIRNLKKIHKQRLGPIGPLTGILLILLFAIALLPLCLFLVFPMLYICGLENKKGLIPSPISTSIVTT